MTNAERYVRIADKNVLISLMLPVSRFQLLRCRVANPFILLVIRILMTNRWSRRRIEKTYGVKQRPTSGSVSLGAQQSTSSLLQIPAARR